MSEIVAQGDDAFLILHDEASASRTSSPAGNTTRIAGYQVHGETIPMDADGGEGQAFLDLSQDEWYRCDLVYKGYSILKLKMVDCVTYRRYINIDDRLGIVQEMMSPDQTARYRTESRLSCRSRSRAARAKQTLESFIDKTHRQNYFRWATAYLEGRQEDSGVDDPWPGQRSCVQAAYRGLILLRIDILNWTFRQDNLLPGDRIRLTDTALECHVLHSYGESTKTDDHGQIGSTDVWDIIIGFSNIESRQEYLSWVIANQ
jgi:hypothetical protein